VTPFTDSMINQALAPLNGLLQRRYSIERFVGIDIFHEDYVQGTVKDSQHNY